MPSVEARGYLTLAVWYHPVMTPTLSRLEKKEHVRASAPVLQCKAEKAVLGVEEQYTLKLGLDGTFTLDVV